ncbi:hypothetical protein D3C85_746000 [compost metagenome]
MARYECGQRVDRAFAVAARLKRVDGGGVDDLAGLVDDGDLAARANAGVQPQHGLGAGGSGQQQVFQIGGEHADGFGFAAFTQAADQLAFECRQQLHAPGPAADFTQPARARRGVQREQAITQLQEIGDARHAGVRHLRFKLGFQPQAQFQHALLTAAQQRQDAMRRQRAQRFVEVEPVAEVGAFGFLAVDHLGIDQSGGPQVLAHVGKQVRVFRVALGQDVARAVQRRLGVVDGRFGVQVLRGQRGGVAGRVGQDGVGQGLKTGFAGDLGARAALGLVRRVQVFQALLGIGGGNFLLQLGRQLALLRDGFKNGATALFELAQIAQAHLKVAQHGIVQAAGGFLAIARNKGHGGAVIQQFHRGSDLGDARAEFGGKLRDDAGVVDAGGDVRDSGSFRHLYTTTKRKNEGRIVP